MKFKIIFFTFIAFTMHGFPHTANAASQDSALYTVENVKADVTSNNAVKAREKAMAQARRKAFDTLSERILDDKARTKVVDIDDITISSLIKNLEIVDEKLSSVRYIATLNITFDKNAINSYFYNTGESFTTSVRRPFLVLPWYISGRQGRLWQDNNLWSIAWQQIAQSGGNVTPFVLPMGDIMDIRDYAVSSPYVYQGEQLDALKQRYGVEDVILAIAEEQGSQIMVQIYDAPMGTPSLLKTINVAKSSYNDSTTYRRGVEQALDFLRSDWKKKTAISSQEPTKSIDVVARYNGLNGWMTLRDLLQDVPGIDSTDVKSVSPQKADISIAYRGDLQNLALMFDQYNIALIQTPVSGQQNYAYNRNNNNPYMQQGRYQPRMQYEIYLKQNRY